MWLICGVSSQEKATAFQEKSPHSAFLLHLPDGESSCHKAFAFIAGHTSGGAPYGLTWEQAGIDSDLPFEEKVRLYREQISGADILSVNEEDELPFD